MKGLRSRAGPEDRGALPPRIALIGFMGAGKSTVGRILAESLGYRFLDLDELVASTAGMPVAEIFHARGEETFRALESSCLAELRHLQSVVIAVGGGAPLAQANRRFFSRDAATFFIDVPLETALRRVSGDATRPLASQGPAVLRELYETRLPVYRVLGLHVMSAGKSPRQVAEEIRRKLTSTRRVRDPG